MDVDKKSLVIRLQVVVDIDSGIEICEDNFGFGYKLILPRGDILSPMLSFELESEEGIRIYNSDQEMSKIGIEVVSYENTTIEI